MESEDIVELVDVVELAGIIETIGIVTMYLQRRASVRPRDAHQAGSPTALLGFVVCTRG